MKKIVGLIVCFSVGFLYSNTEKRYSQVEYVSMWKEVAVKQMLEYKIPASITLAQGILESASGNSMLARLGNNHFGIKCSDWDGPTIYKDDDQKNECFRKYQNAEESFKDHSNFLTTRSRYSELFNLKTNDYKSWAHGLKKSGYATNPKYADLLIELIEKLKLYELDIEVLPSNQFPTQQLSVKKEKVKDFGLQPTSKKREVLMHENKVKYIVAKKGDTFYKISKEFEMSLWQLHKYNDFGDKKDVLLEGDIVYLQPKRNKSKSKNSLLVSTPMTLRLISQMEGVKLNSLMEKNRVSSPDEIIAKGNKIVLK
jgi:LysM repeat protein